MSVDKESILRQRKKDQGRSMSMYKQIRRDLEAQILSGKLPMGAQVPTEKELCDLHGVSRITARKALEDLKKRGIIKRTRGRGSFVDQMPIIQRDGRSAKATEILVAVRIAPSSGSSIPDSWGEQILQRVSQHLLEDGFHASLLPIQDVEGENEEGRWQQFWQRVDSFGERLGGAFFFTNSAVGSLIQGFEKRRLPWVSFGKIEKARTANFVSANNFEGGERVGVEFARQGYDSVLFLSTSLGTISNSDRLYGLLKGWLEGGKNLDSVHWVSLESASGLAEEEQEEVENLLSRQSGRCAVFCSGDLIASSVLRTCDKLGLSVPGKVAVVGGTGLSLSEHTSPTLTVLAQPMAGIAEEACKMLVEMIRTGQKQMPGRYVKSPLIRRESCPIGGNCLMG
ncbi:MAG: substrate-binding domain-containing protein [Chthoniobacterales bacterium]